MSKTSERAGKITKKIYATPKYLAVELLTFAVMIVGGVLSRKHVTGVLAVLLLVMVFNSLFRRQVGREIARSETVG